MTDLRTAGLNRIILINSYLSAEQGSRKIFEFNLSDHTQINGANGSGKTSLLKLIPFFYGMDPGRITKSSNVKKSFSGYYLPYSNSAIIFEYTACTGKTVHVMMTNAVINASSTAIAYRFIPCPFKMENYVIYDPQQKAYRNKTWPEYKEILKLHNIKAEALLTTIDQYRAIIQNIPYKNNNVLRSCYSLGSGRHQIKYLDRITDSLITGRVSFDSIKLLLTEILKQDHADFSLKIEERTLSSWCQDTRGFRLAESMVPDLNKLTILAATVNNDTSVLRGYWNAVQWYLEKNKTTYNLLEKQAADTAKQKENWQKSSENTYVELSSQKLIAEQKYSQLAKEISHAEKIQQDYEETKQAAYWLNEQKAVSAMQDAIATDRSTLAAGNQKYFNLEDGYKRKTAEINENTGKQENSIRQEIADKKLEIQKQLSIIIEKYNEQKNSNNAAETERLHELSLNAEKIRGQIALLTREEKNIAVPEEISQRTAELEQQIHNAEEANNKLQKEQLCIIAEKHKFENERNENIHEAENKTSALDKITTRLNEIKNLLNPDTGILAGFLNAEIPNWRHNIGKVINNDLLTSNTLIPEVIKESKENENKDRITVGSLSLKIADLPDTAEDSTSLEKEQKELIQSSASLKKNIEDLNNKKIELEKQISILSIKYTESQSAMAAEKHLTELNDQLKLSKDKADNFRKKRVLEIGLEKADLEAKVQNAQKEKNSIKLEYQKIEEDRKSAELTDRSEQETKEADFIAARTKHLNEIKDKRSQELADAGQLFNAMLAKEKVDPKLIEQINNRIIKQEEKIKDILNHADLAYEYEKWLDKDGQYISDKRNQLISLSRDKIQQENNLKNFTTSRDNTSKKFNAEIDQINADMNHQKEQLKSLKNIQEIIAGTGIEIMDKALSEPDQTLDSVISGAQQYAEEYINSKKSASDLIDNISSKMTQNGTQKLKSLWDRMPEESSSALSNSTNYAKIAAILNRADNAHLLLDGYLINEKRALILQAGNMLSMISNYHSQLKEFDNRIHGFSTRISHTITQNLQFDAFDSFNIMLETKIQDAAGWSFISRISNYYKDWLINGKLKNELPSNEMVEDMLNLAKSFTDGHLKNEIQDLFTVVFEVSENGKKKSARTAKELEELSSNGLTFLLICALYIGLIHETRGSENVRVHWPVDEMSRLSAKNIRLLISILESNQITMVSAAPDLSTSVAMQFNNIYRIARDGVFMSMEALDPVAAAIDAKLRQNNLQKNAHDNAENDKQTVNLPTTVSATNNNDKHEAANIEESKND